MLKALYRLNNTSLYSTRIQPISVLLSSIHRSFSEKKNLDEDIENKILDQNVYNPSSKTFIRTYLDPIKYIPLANFQQMLIVPQIIIIQKKDHEVI